MKVSEITNKQLLDYLRIDEEEDLAVFLDAAKDYVRNYTGMTDEEIDAKASIVPLIYVIVAEYYENRSYCIKNSNVNNVISSTLNMYCKNLI